MESIKSSVNIDLLIESSRDKVWKAWTDPGLILKWFGSDPNGTGLKAILDVREGGNFEITFRDSDGTEHTCSGVYADVVQNQKLSFSWMWKNEPGVESFVSVSFTPKGDNTQVFFEHANLDSQSKHNYLEGWQRTFMKLETMLNLQNG